MEMCTACYMNIVVKHNISKVALWRKCANIFLFLCLQYSVWCSAGHLLHSGGSVTGKRERESERDLDGEDDTLPTSHKLQRQIAEVTSVHSGKQSSMVNITHLNP